MCGIAGIFRHSETAQGPLPESLGLLMLAAIAHRGPDDGGLLVTPSLLLGHRRLSILDTSDAGHQPMTDERQVAWLVLNGEIYNFRELRGELESLGHRFHSETDTEVLLKSYLQWGRECVQRFNGMFAFAIYDRLEESLWLVRDPVGIKPLFFSDSGGLLRFGSEIKAILADPEFPREPDWRALDRFFTFGYTPAPWTGFANVSQLLPGEWLLARSGRIERHQWYRLPIADPDHGTSLEESAERFDAAFSAAVRRQMVSDVPLGAFLSGGLDSSAIVRAMRASDAREIESFSVGFSESSFDESAFARQVAGTYATKHHSLVLNDETAALLLATVVSHAEEPLADNSAIPVYCVSEFARRHVTVALSGDGADELLAGYDTYRASALAPKYRRLPGMARRLLSGIVHGLPASTAKYGSIAMARRFVAGAGLPFPYDHCSWRRFLSESQRQSLYTAAYLKLSDENPLEDYARVLAEVPEGLAPLEKQLYLDTRFHLPNDLLAKVDRMSMAHGLEVRVPFLDLEILKECARIPTIFKRQGKDGKRILKEILKRDLPREIVDRRKSGFLVPIEKWFRADWNALVTKTLTPEFIDSTGMLKSAPIRAMIQQQQAGRADLAYPLYGLLVFGLWWRLWISRELPLSLTSHAAKLVRIVHLRRAKGA